MAMFGRRDTIVRLFFRRLGMIALLIVVLIGFSTVWDVFHKERESRVLKDEAERQVADLRLQREHLTVEIANLETDRGKEEALREQFQMGRAGEQLIVIVEPPKPEPVATTTTWKTWVGKFLPFWSD